MTSVCSMQVYIEEYLTSNAGMFDGIPYILCPVNLKTCASGLHLFNRSLEPIPGKSGYKVGYTLDGVPTQWRVQLLTHSHTTDN